MGTLVISENITLDGVIEDPTGDDGFSRGGWFSRISEEDRQGWAEVESAQAFDAVAELYGRRTYEWLTTRWATREGAWADRLRTMPKYVVSATLEQPVWPNTTILRGDIVDEVARLRQQLDGELVLVGSGRLAHTLIEADVVDEFRLIVYPFVAADGTRLFEKSNELRSLRLLETRTVGRGLVLTRYGTSTDGPARDAG
jgi:dihydrofolate reductase